MFCFSYNPQNIFITTHLESIGKVIDSLSAKYEKFNLIADFNATEYETSFENFCDTYSFKNLLKEPTYFKNPYNSKCVDLMMTNRSRKFCVNETRLIDFHKMTVTELRSHLLNLGPQIIRYDYKIFSKRKFRLQINKECEKFQKALELDSFLNICNTALNEMAPLKQKYARNSNSPFMNKTIFKALIKRVRLRNNFLKCRCEANKRAYQRAFLILLMPAFFCKKSAFSGKNSTFTQSNSVRAVLKIF